MYNSKVTNKFINNSFNNVLRVGYCSMWHLLKGKERNGYTSGAYGWNANFYVINYDTAIVTGYRPTGNIHPDYEIVEKYENAAKAVWEDKTSYTVFTYEQRKEKVNNLLNEFIKEATSK